MLLCTSLAALMAGCAAVREPSTAGSNEAPAPSPSSSATANAPGDAATWRLQPGQDLQKSATKFTALVSRLSCNSGVTGQVLAPTIDMPASQIVVTFTVAAGRAGGGACIGNNEVPYEVELGEPLRDRKIIDGQCLPDGEGQPPGYCGTGATRFSP